jgi:hypothetical protein
MKARARLLGASYEPETIRAMLQAFDAAWATVRFHFYDSPESFEAARLGLANAILLEAADDHRDVQQLKAAGLAAHYLGPGDFSLEAYHAAAGTQSKVLAFLCRRDADDCRADEGRGVQAASAGYR